MAPKAETDVVQTGEIMNYYGVINLGWLLGHLAPAQW